MKIDIIIINCDQQIGKKTPRFRDIRVVKEEEGERTLRDFYGWNLVFVMSPSLHEHGTIVSRMLFSDFQIRCKSVAHGARCV